MPLGISLDSNIFQVGVSKLEGSVFFDIAKEVPAKELVAMFEGYEITRVEYDEGTGDDRRTRTNNARRRLVQLPILLNNDLIVHGKVQSGKYQVKFQVDLPDGLPSSMEGSGRSFADRCKIEYFIRAQLKGSGWISDYKAKQPVTIVAKPLQRQHRPYRGEPVQRTVRSCCCWNRGQILFGARVEDTMLDKGEAVKVSMSCKNQTGVQVSGVQATLLEILTWSAQNRSEHRSRTLATVDFPQFSGLEQVASLGSAGAQQIFRSIQKDLENGTHSGTIVMPTDANDTFVGKLVSCRHTLRVVVKTGCCIDNPEIEIPIQAGPVALHGQSSQPSTQPPGGFIDGATVSDPVLTPSTPAAVMGGSPYAADSGAEDEQEIVIPSLFNPPPPSMERLLKELEDSISDYDLVKERTGDPNWNPVFEDMTSAEYGKIIRIIDLEFDQTNVAECLAPAIGSKFSCDYCVAAVRSASDYNRSSIVEKVIPFCSDLSTNKNKILAELSDWEKTVTERAFDNALK